MKFRLFATAAIAAAAISAPAFAQQAIGSVGVNAATTNVEAFGGEIDGQAYSVDGSVAFQPSEAWTVNLQGNLGTTDGDLSDESFVSVGAGLTYNVADWRVGPAFSYTDTGAVTVWTGSAVAQKYIGDVTLSAAVTYSDVEDLELDAWTVGGEVRYFVTDNFRIQGGLSYAEADIAGFDVDAWNVGVGGEYQFASTPWSITGAYARGTLDDLDLTTDTFSLGVRYSFGGDLKARDRSGADLSAGGNPVTSFISLF